MEYSELEKIENMHKLLVEEGFVCLPGGKGFQDQIFYCKLGTGIKLALRMKGPRAIGGAEFLYEPIYSQKDSKADVDGLLNLHNHPSARLGPIYLHQFRKIKQLREKMDGIIEKLGRSISVRKDLSKSNSKASLLKVIENSAGLLVRPDAVPENPKKLEKQLIDQLHRNTYALKMELVGGLYAHLEGLNPSNHPART